MGVYMNSLHSLTSRYILVPKCIQMLQHATKCTQMLAIITKATVAEIAGTDSRNRALAFISASPLVVVIPGADDTSPCII